MELLKVPAKYDRCGIKVKCLKCKWQLGDGKCHENKDGSIKSISKCSSKDKHRFNLTVCVPSTDSRRMKIIKTRDFSEALIEMENFKKELIETNYQKPIQTVQQTKSGDLLIELCADYLDFQSGENTPSHLKRNRSKDHISDCKRTLERFCIALSKKGYNIEILDVKNIGDNEVGYFHDYLVEEFGFVKDSSSYNRHFRVGKAFINWCIEQKQIDMFNPFTKAELKVQRKNLEVITKEEFQKLLEVTTEENGFDPNPQGKKQNAYFPWLITAFKLAIETGLRNDEIIRLKWSDLSTIDKDKKAFQINDFKVNRKQYGKEEGKNKKIVPLTAGLMDLLNELGFEENKGKEFTILDTKNYGSDSTIEKAISRAFGHYIKLVTDKPLQFKNLRKTYISHLVMQLGDKAKLFTGHSDDEVLMNHYISKAWTAGGLSEFRVF
jgi:integrase